MRVALDPEGQIGAEWGMLGLVGHQLLLAGEGDPPQVVERAQLHAVQPLTLELVGRGDLGKQSPQALQPIRVRR
jgi:hypothetical protein